MKLSLLLIALISFNTAALDLDYSAEYSTGKTTLHWKGSTDSKYNFDLQQLGFTVFDRNSNFGIRLAYGKGSKTLPTRCSNSCYIVMTFDHSIDLELLYRARITDNLNAYWGAGYYIQSFPIYSTISDFKKNDTDNDNGYTVGIEYKMTNSLSTKLTYHYYSSIGPDKNDSGALGSSHQGYSAAISYNF